MGKKNPIKQVMSAAADLTFNPIREVARTVGADGAVKAINDVKGFEEKVGHGTIDLINDEKGKQKKKEKAAGEAQARIDTANAAAETERTNAANYAASEAERMSAGSKSRTLLTGPAGLDDEDNRSVTRRTLQAR